MRQSGSMSNFTNKLRMLLQQAQQENCGFVRLGLTALVFRKGRYPTAKQQSGISLTQMQAFTCRPQCLPLTNGSSLTQSLQGTGIALRPTFIKLAFAANRAVLPGNRRQNLSDCANRKQHILATIHKFCAIIASHCKQKRFPVISKLLN